MVSQRDNNNDDFSAVLRSAVGSTEFDYAALIAGSQQRAGRIRRRRALTAGAAVAVLGPALIGGATLVLPEILPDNGSGTVLPAASVDKSGPTLTDDTSVTSASTASQAPWQDAVPPMPQGGPDPDNPDFPNAWVIPDARPTGVGELDALGAPQLLVNYPRIAPVMGLMTCDPGRVDGVEPVAAQHASLSPDDESGSEQSGSAQSDLWIDITVTGWQDSNAARDGLRGDSYTLCTWDAQVGQAQPWPGHEGDADYQLYATDTPGEVAAVVRQGDYLIAITVQPPSADTTTVGTTDDTTAGTAAAKRLSRQSTDVAAEIASKMADNLEVLDPAHGRD